MIFRLKCRSKTAAYQFLNFTINNEQLVPQCAERQDETDNRVTTHFGYCLNPIFSLFGHIARMSDETDAKKILTTPPCTTWTKTIQQDLKSKNLSVKEPIAMAQNRPLWRLMTTFGATHSKCCIPEKNNNKKKN